MSPEADDVVVTGATRDWSDQVCYQVFVRSFRDGNGDGIGDFRGLIEGLDYLQALGVTSLWLNPIFASPSHHNYFPTDFFETDPDYGTRADFAALCRAVHDRGMKILLDSETQYLPAEHAWFQAALADRDSPLRRRFLFREDDPDDWLHLCLHMPVEDRIVEVGLRELPLLNLRDPDVVEFQRRFYRFWLDPLGDGDRRGGVDGYRLDHVMDDLDDYGVLTGLLQDFWRPLIDHVRDVAPDAFFLAEQADWQDEGGALLTEAGIDGVFAIPLMFALRSLRRGAIEAAIRRARDATATGRSPFLILENHDVTRYATAVGERPGPERLGAALSLTLPGIPTLYYGQELGMTGQIGEPDDDVHIPAREAFRWHRDVDAPGMAVWYRDHRFWSRTGITRPDGRALEDQRGDPASLWHWYRRLIALRRASPALCRGDCTLLESGHPDVLAFRRRHRDEAVTVVAHLGTATARLSPDSPANPAGATLVGDAGDGRELGPWAVRIVDETTAGATAG